MKIIQSDEDYIEIDFDRKSIKGRTKKRNLKRQFEVLREMVGDTK